MFNQINKITTGDDNEMYLKILIKDQTLDAPKIIPKKIKPTVIPTTVATNLGAPPEAIQQSEILKGGAVEIASHLFSKPERPGYTEDKIVKKTLANGQSGLMAAVDGMGGKGLGHGLIPAEIVQTDLLKIKTDEVPTIDQAYDLVDNVLVESGKQVREYKKKVGDNDADAVVSGGIFYKSPNAGDERKFF